MLRFKIIPKNVIDSVPAYWRARFRVAEHNLSNILSGNHYTDRMKLCRANGTYRLSVMGEDLFIVSPDRWYIYKNGVSARVNKLSKTYGYGDYYSISESDVVVDIGANIGEFSMFCSKLGATVYSVEADDNVFKTLTANAAQKNIDTNNYAIWNKNEQIEFFSEIDTADSSLIQPLGGAVSITKEAVTLDWLIQQKGINKIKLIKCDAEGAEPEVLEGAANALKIAEYVTFDCGKERRGESTIDECIEILKNNDFEILQGEKTGRYILVAKNKRFV